MGDLHAYLFIAIGVFISAIAPVAIKWVNERFRPQPVGISDDIKQFAINYFLLAIASLIIGIVTLAIVKNSGGEFTKWYEPFLIGYFFDSTLQKTRGGILG